MYINIEFFSYFSCTIAFSVLSTLIFFGKKGGTHRKILLTATASTAIWSGSAALAPWIGTSGAVFALLELFRTLSWVFVAYSLFKARLGGGASKLYKSLLMGLFGLSITITCLGVLTANLPAPQYLLMASQTALGGTRVILAVIGLMLVENIFRNAGPEKRWALKYICFGMVTIFGYDFLLHADSVLFLRLDPALFGARGFINALAAPLIAISVSRYETWDMDIHVSRRIVFHTAALLASGLYLLGIAGAGFYLKQFGGNWGQILQIVFLFGAVIAFVALLGSASARAR
jgi:putative PEP-CTERM system histidine kinase